MGVTAQSRHTVLQTNQVSTEEHTAYEQTGTFTNTWLPIEAYGSG